MTDKTPTTTPATTPSTTPALKHAKPEPAFVTRGRARAQAQAAASAGKPGRLIFGLDATASREATWDAACGIQSEMFREVAAIGGLAMKLVFFRGVDIQSFPFTSDGEQLAREMGKIGCIGGYTQIEKLLKHAAKVTEQERVQALVFVGDSVEEDFDCISGAAGELGKLGVPAFVFHEKSEPDPMAAKLLGISPARTEQTFREIALRTSGVY